MTPQPLTNIEKSRKLHWALLGDSFGVVYVYLVMAGPVFLLFLDHLKLDKSQIGLLLSLIAFGGLIAIFTGPIASRLGLKRVFLFFWFVRKFVMAGLIFSPFIFQRYGTQAGFIYVVVVIGIFAFCRSFGESALALWSHEFVPAAKRGKFSAMQTVVIMVLGGLSIAAAGWFLGENPPTSRFLILFSVGLLFGFGCVYCYAHVPGGAPIPVQPLHRNGLSAYLEPLRDKRFIRLLIASAMVNIGWFTMTPFLPLFHRDIIGLKSDQVVTLDAVYMAGQLLTCFLWGWTADRYGGKPQMVLNLALLALYPIALMLLPRNSAMSNPTAWGILFVLGLVMPGWAIGFGRTLFVDLIPADKKMLYLPIQITCSAAVIGISPLLAGFILDHIPNFSRNLGWFHLDPYSPFFIFAAIMIFAAACVFWTIPTGNVIPVSTFAGMFVQGNPIAAVQAIISHQYAAQEGKRIIAIERLGQTNSPLGIEELISSLFDPSFNVRYEAIVSVARTRAHPRLTEAMIRVLTQGTPELRAAAAWALGRMGDKNAIPSLELMLDSPYPMLRSRTARALGTLNHTAGATKILAMFHEEADPGIAVGYVSALAILGQDQVVGQMLDFLEHVQDQAIREETALAISSLLGKDIQAMRLWRRMFTEPGDTLGGIMMSMRKRLIHPHVAHADIEELKQTIDKCTRSLSMEHYEEGLAELRQIILGVRSSAYSPLAQIVFKKVEPALEKYGVSRVEYLFLAVHTLHVGMTDTARNAAG